MYLLIWILHIQRKPPKNTCHRTPQFCPRKILSDTTPLAMQERNLRIISPRPSIIIRNAVPVLVRIDPSLRVEFLTPFPEQRTPVYRPRTEDDSRAGGNEFSCYRCIAYCFANRGWDRGVQSENFLADAVEQGQGFEVCVADWAVAGWDFGADFFPQTGLIFWMLVEEVAGPGKGAGCCFMLVWSVLRL
jgi:hypothetical protein